MKLWGPWVLVLVCCGWILASASRDPAMLQDTDTVAILDAIERRQSPLSWFAGDWPLGNRFYRPVSSLVFEADAQTGWFGFSNAVLVAGSLVALFWVAVPLVGLWSGAAAVVLSTLVVQGFHGRFGAWLGFGLALVVAWRAWRSGSGPTEGGTQGAPMASGRGPWVGRGLGPVGPRMILLVLASLYLGWEFAAAEPLRFRMMDWIPGRTASTMTLFALLALGSALRAGSAAPAQGRALAPRSSGDSAPGQRKWVLLTWIFTAAALGSYEQAVMLPALLTGIPLLALLQRRPPNWTPAVGAWILLGGYLLLRKSVLPPEPSAYIDQQLRSGGFAFVAIAPYVWPSWDAWLRLRTELSTSAVLLLTAGPWIGLLRLVANAGGYLAAGLSPDRWKLLLFWSWSVLAFLPMAWLHPFEHYHFWPVLLRSLFWVLLFRDLWTIPQRSLAPSDSTASTT